MQHSYSPSGAPAQAPLRVGLLGLGVVGSGTQRVLSRNRDLIRARAGRDIELLMVAARDLQRARQRVGPGVEVLADGMALVRHPQIDVVVEAIGGCTVARELVLQAIAHGKHVVTANKALLAEHGAEIFGAARERGVIVAFEGAVAVSIPIVKALREGLAANRIEWVAGIVNGTSNFILSQMRDKGSDFDSALREAQRLGYAEADPAFDVDGVDAGHKLALLAGMAFGAEVPFGALHIEGIRALQPADQRHAERLGFAIKLLAIARRRPEGLELRVHPALVPARSLMAGVDGSMNAVMVKGDAAGVTMYYGAGAGSEQTASAVIADLVDVARLAGAAPSHRVPHLGFHPEGLQALPVLPIGEVVTRHYLCVPCGPEASALAHVMELLAGHGVTADTHLDAHLEAASADAGSPRELVFITHEAEESAVRGAIEALGTLACVRGAVRHLRVERLVA